MNGLLTVNIELTSFCNKNCWMCGRRKIDRDYPELKLAYGNIEFEILEKLSRELPEGIMVQFHNNGEPLMYPRLKEALSLFEKQIRCFNTNGKLLMEKKDDIIDNLDTITISTFQDDPEWFLQYEMVKKFLEYKGERSPNVIIRVLGELPEERLEKYRSLNCIMAERILHSPMGSFKYEKKTTVPETGICLEILSHPAININGDVSICVRFDPERKGVLGNVMEQSFSDIWNSEKRKQWKNFHVKGKRKEVPLCEKCEFWGVPRGL